MNLESLLDERRKIKISTSMEKLISKQGRRCNCKEELDEKQWKTSKIWWNNLNRKVTKLIGTHISFSSQNMTDTNGIFFNTHRKSLGVEEVHRKAVHDKIKSPRHNGNIDESPETNKYAINWLKINKT